MALKDYFHFTQAYEINVPEEDLDFFDPNLAFDTKLFVDPFLLKRSPVVEEVDLYKRFNIYFNEVLKRTIDVESGKRQEGYLYNFLLFPEPKEACLGYTEQSNDGLGLGGIFARAVTAFFLKGIASKLLNKNLFIDSQFNPESLMVFADDVADDGISDLTINLNADYFVKYTQDQCKKFGIHLKSLPLTQSFDFEEMEWTNGQHYFLPENPLKPGTSILLIPKRLLRTNINTQLNIKSKAIGILKGDPILKRRFISLISKPLVDIGIEDVRSILSSDEEVLKRYLALMEAQYKQPYDFNRDPLEFLAIKKYKDYFDLKLFAKKPTNSKELLDSVERLIKLFKEEFELRNGWRDAWCFDSKGRKREINEPAWGRKFRAMGLAFYDHFKEVTFLPEVGTGNGFSDFLIVRLDDRIEIEIKKLSNSSPKGENPKLPSYLHGIQKQLPQYIRSHECKYGIYITGQHRFAGRGVGDADDTSRAIEIRSLLPKISEEIKEVCPYFEKLSYFNIDLAPKRSASNS